MLHSNPDFGSTYVWKPSSSLKIILKSGIKI